MIEFNNNQFCFSIGFGKKSKLYYSLDKLYQDINQKYLNARDNQNIIVIIYKKKNKLSNAEIEKRKSEFSEYITTITSEFICENRCSAKENSMQELESFVSQWISNNINFTIDDFVEVNKLRISDIINMFA